MSSTYVHYSTPSSLPSDYALLSRYATAHNNLSDHQEDDEQAVVPDEVLNGDDDIAPSSSKKKRRSSFPTSYITPFNPTMGPLPDKMGRRSGPMKHQSTETTPLLAPLVPRIQEDVDNEDVNPPTGRRPNVLWEETKILAKYTLPVFGVTGYSIIQGFTSTLDTMLPSAWTSSQPKLVGLWSQRMAVVMAACLIPIMLIWLSAESILLGLKQDPEVAHLAGIYLKYALIGLPAYAFNSISRRYFQSQGLFDVPTRVIICVAPINALLNWLLVWGPKPIRLGFIGAPIATSISFNLISLCSIIYGVCLGVLVQLGLAGVGQTASEWWSWELVGLAASLLGPIVLATQSVLLVSASSTFQAPFALSVATSVRIGNLLGEENAIRASYAAKASVVMAFFIAAIWSAMFMIFRNSWAHLFNDDPRVVRLTASILPLVALFQVFDGISAVTGGILRAQGKQFTGALLNLSAYYVIGIPFGMWLAFKRDMGLHGLWVG
ncbi:hypothetical protein EW026_g4664 [Hermanssonia centrifuga]|uniref:MATE efflux family protein n=1 Tax=Hermanssonia centrifuga TaxID=98765 RepID=A0A4S4KGF4_9APHY|nr:hypothetical protein EW026_g4664 [Hermanssonia centrifuga]